MGDLNAALGIAPEVPEAPPGPPPLPPLVAASLPPGTPSSLVFQNADGCYLFSVEVTDPPSGFPVNDAAGNPVCEGQPVAVPAGAVPAGAVPDLGGGVSPDIAGLAG
jgi:hypothetical protein